jgi:hypothetical protein
VSNNSLKLKIIYIILNVKRLEKRFVPGRREKFADSCQQIRSCFGTLVRRYQEAQNVSFQQLLIPSTGIVNKLYVKAPCSSSVLFMVNER